MSIDYSNFCLTLKGIFFSLCVMCGYFGGVPFGEGQISTVQLSNRTWSLENLEREEVLRDKQKLPDPSISDPFHASILGGDKQHTTHH